MLAHLSNETIIATIAVLGFALSIWNVLRDWLYNRKNITISIPFVFCNEHNMGYSFVMIEFVNNSKLPLTITRIQATIDDKIFELGFESERMFEYTYPERKGRVSDDSILLPLSVDSLGYKRALFHIRDWPIIKDKSVSFIIGTNRGHIKKTVEIADIITDVKALHKKLG